MQGAIFQSLTTFYFTNPNFMSYIIYNNYYSKILTHACLSQTPYCQDNDKMVEDTKKLVRTNAEQLLRNSTDCSRIQMYSKVRKHVGNLYMCMYCICTCKTHVHVHVHSTDEDQAYSLHTYT